MKFTRWWEWLIFFCYIAIIVYLFDTWRSILGLCVVATACWLIRKRQQYIESHKRHG